MESAAFTALFALIQKFLDDVHDLAESPDFFEILGVYALVCLLLEAHDQVDGVNAVEVQLGEQIRLVF